jgi:hypothetical protein
MSRHLPEFCFEKTNPFAPGLLEWGVVRVQPGCREPSAEQSQSIRQRQSTGRDRREFVLKKQS